VSGLPDVLPGGVCLFPDVAGAVMYTPQEKVPTNNELLAQFEAAVDRLACAYVPDRQLQRLVDGLRVQVLGRMVPEYHPDHDWYGKEY
jgi:hypothetical protein